MAVLRHVHRFAAGWPRGQSVQEMVDERYVNESERERGLLSTLWSSQLPERVDYFRDALLELGVEAPEQVFGLIEGDVPAQLEFAVDEHRVRAELHGEQSDDPLDFWETAQAIVDGVAHFLAG